MALKVIFSVCIFALSSHCLAADEELRHKYTSVEYLKNYAFSTCIADGYRSEEVVKDASAAARGYLELGGLPIEAHTEATLLGRKFLNREYASMSGEKMILMKCMDFYNSKDLNLIARKYWKKK